MTHFVLGPKGHYNINLIKEVHRTGRTFADSKYYIQLTDGHTMKYIKWTDPSSTTYDSREAVLTEAKERIIRVKERTDDKMA